MRLLGILGIVVLATRSLLFAADYPVPGTAVGAKRVVAGPSSIRVTLRPAPGTVPQPAFVTGAKLHIFDTALPSAGYVTYDLGPSPWGGEWVGFGQPPGSRRWAYSGAVSAFNECTRLTVRDGLVRFRCDLNPGGGVHGFYPPMSGELGVVLEVGDQRYCANFGGSVQRNVPGLFRATGAPAPGTCPVPACGRFLRKWGSIGNGDGEFASHVSGIALDAAGDVLVSDLDNDRVQKFTAAGAFVSKWGSAGTGDGQFDQPWGIAVASNGDVYVVDSGNRRIQRFSADGTFIAKWGTAGFGDGQFDIPEGIAVGPSGDVYVADRGRNRIQRFDATGSFIAAWGPPSGYQGALSEVAVDGSEVIFASGGTYVHKFTASGTHLATWTGSHSYVYGLVVDENGDVYTGSSNIVRFTGAGTYIANWGVAGPGDGQFGSPDGLAARAGEVYAGGYGVVQVTACP